MPLPSSAFERNLLFTAKSGTIRTVGTLFEYGSRFLVAFLLARFLGAEQYGLYQLTLVAGAIAANLALFGLDDALVRYVPILTSRRDEAGVWGALQICAVLALFFWLLLKFTQRTGRYRRTLTALLGTGALLALPQAPLVFFFKAASTAGQSPAGPTLGLLFVLFWSIVVQAHIASRALSSNIGVGLAVALAYFLLSYQVSGQFPPAAR